MQHMTRRQEQVARAITAVSEMCDRDILAVRNDGRAALTLVGPDSLMFTWLMLDPRDPAAADFIFDLFLN